MLESLSRTNTEALSGATRHDDHATSYRADIDGLRAIAVIAVVVYHAHLSAPGGFIGVDVFFVISGYLITKIIDSDLQRGRFSLAEFYQRRIRRIFPALFVLLAICLPFAWELLLPDQLTSFGSSMMASAAFVANLFFHGQVGYFDTASEQKPLLHLWSLAVEEQFYIFWPFVLAISARLAGARGTILLCAAIFCGSLLYSEYLVHRAPSEAFYLLPGRAWELALGALLALTSKARGRYRIARPAADLASIAGIGLLAYAILGYDAKMPFPGFAALVPCLGAALVIAAGEQGSTLGGRVLSLPPVAFVGRISYSLYLWHWPILVFAALYYDRALTTEEACWAVALAFVAACLSWRLVEKPFRDLRVTRAHARIWIGGGLAAGLAAVCAGDLLVANNGFPSRLPDRLQVIDDAKAELKAFQVSPCMVRGGELPPVEGCLLGLAATGADYDVVLWGDSYAAQLAPVLDALGRKLRFTAREITKVGCPALPDVRFYYPVEEVRELCPHFNATVMATLLRHKPLVVVLASNWDGFARGAILVAERSGTPTPDEARRTIAKVIGNTVRALTEAGHRVVIVGQAPEPGRDPIACLERQIERRPTARLPATGCALPAAFWAESHARVSELMRGAIEGQRNVHLAFPFGRLCDGQVCPILTRQGEFAFMDSMHLSAAGARMLDEELGPAILTARRPLVAPSY